MVQPRLMVEAPPVTPLPFGLLSAAAVVDDLDGHAQMGVQYEPQACGDVYQTRAACEEAAFSVEDNGHRGIPLVEGDPFTLFSLFSCNPVGLGAEGLRAKAGESLRNGEGRGVETAFAERLPLAEGAVDLTNGGAAVHVIDGLAALEAFAAANYGGVPTIHVPRGVGTVMGSLGGMQRSSDGRHLETRQGALVASGGGYSNLSGPPTDAEDPENTIQPPQTGEAWIYVTGTVLIHRASQPSATPLVLNRVVDGDSRAASNEGLVLAARPYVAMWECITAAVKVATAFSGTVIDGGGA